MKRRAILRLGGGAAFGVALPAIAQAQRVMRIGTLDDYPLSTYPASSEQVAWNKISADELRRLGWEEGRNLIYERRFALGDPQKHYANAEELVTSGVDLLAVGSPVPTAAAYKATKSIPIVTQSIDLVESGYAKSLARPGGNVTGIEWNVGLGAVGFKLIYETLPGLKKIGFSAGQGMSLTQSGFEVLQRVASAKGVAVVPLPDISGMADIDRMLIAARREGIQALILGRATFFLAGQGAQRIQAWATENKVLTFSGNWHRGQLLMAHGPDFGYFYRAQARVIDRVLRGAKPADIPIERAMRFELIINKQLAKAMGLTIPVPVLLQATEVIE